MIPTAIRRWTAIERSEYPREDWATWGKDIDMLDDEVMIIYRSPRIIIRWSPFSVAIDRVLRCHK